jgi:hypothetical protein
MIITWCIMAGVCTGYLYANPTFGSEDLYRPIRRFLACGVLALCFWPVIVGGEIYELTHAAREHMRR